MIKNMNELTKVFVDIVDEYQECTRKIEKKNNLFVGQTEVLFLLKEKTGRSQKELAFELGVSKATIGVSLRRMELSGLVNRVTDIRDARCIRVSLTEKGNEVCNKCEEAYKQIYVGMFGGFDEKQKAEALKALNKMASGIEAVKEKIVK